MKPLFLIPRFWFSLYLIRCHQRFKIVQGGIPANYGGRVSSVLDIYQKTVAVKSSMLMVVLD
jgi:hypothetical protein